jgi:hypothetical protein
VVLHDEARGNGVGAPTARLVRDTRLRAVYIWAGLRVFLFLGFGLFVAGFSPDESLQGLGQLLAYLLGVASFLWVVGVAATLVLLDVRVVRETLLFANLGVSQARILLVALPPIVALEALLQLFGEALLRR